MLKEKNDHFNEFASDGSAMDNYSKGMKLATTHFGPLLAVTIITFIVSAISNFLPQLLSTAISLFVVVPLSAGAGWVYLKAARKEDFEISDMFVAFGPNYVNIVLASFLSYLAMGIGFLLFIIPGIYIAVRLSFTSYLLIDKDMGAMDAMRESWEMTDGYGWTIFGMMILALVILFIGVIALVVGIVFSLMVIYATFGIFYHYVDRQLGDSAGDDPFAPA